MICYWLGHKWVAKQAGHRNIYDSNVSVSQCADTLPINTKTRVLWQCGRCNKARSEDIDGQWTLADFEFDEEPEDTAKPEPDNELARLRKMSGL